MPRHRIEIPSLGYFMGVIFKKCYTHSGFVLQVAALVWDIPKIGHVEGSVCLPSIDMKYGITYCNLWQGKPCIPGWALDGVNRKEQQAAVFGG